jgi:hypothetical protein
MRRSLEVGLLFIASFLAPRSADANILCKWLGQCFYESPGFRITVVDKEAGQPLANVHALAEWVQYGYHGTNGPLMVQDALSGPDGVLAFAAWGPMRGSTAGLVLNQDPVISMFKPGYKVLIVNNHPGTDEKARVRGFTQDRQTFPLEPFRGTIEEWVKQLDKAAYPAAVRLSESEREEVRAVYLNRKRRVKIEVERLPTNRREVEQLLDSLARSIKFLEGDSRQ